MNDPAQTITCGHCGTDMKSFARVCSGCNAVRGVGRLANGQIVGPEWIGRTRLLLAAFVLVAVVFALNGLWVGALLPGFIAGAMVVQSGSVIFSRGREYWFR